MHTIEIHKGPFAVEMPAPYQILDLTVRCTPPTHLSIFLTYLILDTAIKAYDLSASLSFLTILSYVAYVCVKHRPFSLYLGRAAISVHDTF